MARRGADGGGARGASRPPTEGGAAPAARWRRAAERFCARRERPRAAALAAAAAALGEAGRDRALERRSSGVELREQIVDLVGDRRLDPGEAAQPSQLTLLHRRFAHRRRRPRQVRRRQRRREVVHLDRARLELLDARAQLAVLAVERGHLVAARDPHHDLLVLGDGLARVRRAGGGGGGLEALRLLPRELAAVLRLDARRRRAVVDPDAGHHEAGAADVFVVDADGGAPLGPRELGVAVGVDLREHAADLADRRAAKVALHDRLVLADAPAPLLARDGAVAVGVERVEEDLELGAPLRRRERLLDRAVVRRPRPPCAPASSAAPACRAASPEPGDRRVVVNFHAGHHVGPLHLRLPLASGGAASMCTSALPSGEDVKLNLAASGGAIVW